MNLDGLEVLFYGLGFLIIAAFGVWMASIVAIFTAKNPVIKTLAIMLNLLILSVVILAVIDNAGEQAYEESRYQENDKELLIDGIRIPAGSRLVVEPQMGIKKVPDFSTFSRVEYLHPIDWKGVTVGEMERVVSQYDGHYEATLTTRSGNGTGGVVEVEGWRCRSDNDILWGVKNENWTETVKSRRLQAVGMPIGQVGGSIGPAMAGSDEAALGKGEVRAVGGILGGGYPFGEPALLG